MKAVVCRNGALEVQDVPQPEPGPGNVLLRVLRAGICGSDLHARTHCDATAAVVEEVGYDHFMRSSDSVVMGHEFVGEVVSYGPRCRRRWKPGTRLCALPIIKHGGEVEMVGLSEQAPGAYAEYVEVSEDLAIPVPDGVTDDDAALVEPLAVAHHAVRRSGVGKRDVAVVIGCGPIGLSVILLLKAAGVKTVVAGDYSEKRRELARACGADAVVDPATESPYTAVKQQKRYFTRAGDLFDEAFKALHLLQTIPGMPWRQVVRFADDNGLTPTGPVIFECVGLPGVIDSILTAAPFRSRVTVVGVCMEPDVFRPVMAINKEIDLRFVFGYNPDEFAEVVHLVSKRKVDPSVLVTGTVGLDGAVAAFDALGGAERHAKVLIDPASPVRDLT
ncbi:MAG: zinc-binding dehydrogenase [Gordonia sp. (in: high G+C Gram-positive bacteria)]|uniref:zinc-binding dehydrogenase n=1 Tax=Gordonia sp. (in: high G+C Gram-positive bacteria) TaxID=84139 RepID=UPI0039E3432D